jgi:hypothetical protein
VGHQAVAQGVELLLRELLVDLAPEDVPLGRRLADDGLVLGGAARVLARVDEQRAVAREDALAAPRDLLVEFGRGQIPVDVRRLRDAHLVEPHAAAPAPPVLHDVLFRQNRCRHRLLLKNLSMVSCQLFL